MSWESAEVLLGHKKIGKFAGLYYQLQIFRRRCML